MTLQSKQLRGTSISKEDLDSRRVLSVFYRPNARYSWAAGVAIGRFLTELKAGRIVGRKCRKCGRIMVPPRMFCEWCFRPNDEWVLLPDTGTINTFSISHIATDASRLKKPIIPAVIILDGTTEAGLLHLVGEVHQSKVRIGMDVKAVWKKPEARVGSITDISHFKPV